MFAWKHVICVYCLVKTKHPWTTFRVIFPQFSLVEWSVTSKSNSQCCFILIQKTNHDYPLANSKKLKQELLQQIFENESNNHSKNIAEEVCVIFKPSTNRMRYLFILLRASGQHSKIWRPILQKFCSSPNRRDLYDGRIHMKCSVSQACVCFSPIRRSCRNCINLLGWT